MGWIPLIVCGLWCLVTGCTHAERIRRENKLADTRVPTWLLWIGVAALVAVIAPFVLFGWAAWYVSGLILGDKNGLPHL